MNKENNSALVVALIITVVVTALGVSLWFLSVFILDSGQFKEIQTNYTEQDCKDISEGICLKFNPPKNDPPIPTPKCYAVKTGSELYYLTNENNNNVGHFIFESPDGLCFKGICPDIGEQVTLKGTIKEKSNVYGNPYKAIQLITIT